MRPLVGAWVDPACPVNWARPLNRGLVAWWLVTPTAGWRGGLTLRDLARGGRYPNDGTLTNGPAWRGAAGRPGGYGSLLLDGVNDLVLVPSSAALNVETLTISCSVKTIRAAGQILVEKWSVVGGYPYSLRLNANGTATLLAFDGTNNPSATSTAAVNDGAWHHVAATRTKGGTLQVYVDGQASGASAADTATGTSTNASPVGLGDRASGTTQPFLGNLDDGRVYGRALAAGEVRALYGESRRGHPDTLRWLLGVAGGGGRAVPRLMAYYRRRRAG